MQDNYFDQLIRTKLQSYEVPEGPSDWDALAERLDADFDAALAEKLATASVAYDPADWEAMEEKLTQPLDAVVREKLEGYEVPFVAADWEAMEAAMSHPFDMAIQAKLTGLSFTAFDANWAEMGAHLDADFDADMRTQMDQVHLEPVPGDWDAMATMLDAAQPIGWYQRFAPVLDGVLLLVIALLWWGGNGDAPSDMLKTSDSLLHATVIEQEQATDPANSQENNDIDLPTEVEKTPTDAVVEKKEGNHAVQQLNISHSTNRPIQTTSLEVAEIGIPKDPRPASTEEELVNSPPTETHVAAKKPYRLASLEPLTEVEMLSMPVMPLGMGEEEKGFSIPGLRIGTAASIFSSAAEFNDKGLMGYLAGLRVELPISEKISIISGLQVGKKHFDRMKLNVSTNNGTLNRQPTFWMSRLKGNIKLLEIPVLLRYKFSTDKKVNFYFQGGFSPVITLDEEYLHYDPRSAGNLSQTQMRSDIDFTTAQDNPALEAYLNSLQPNVDVHNLNTYAGFLQVAPGMEVKMNAHLSLQLEPYIQLGLQRIGSERQSIHSLGGSFSLMYHFPNR